MGSWHEGVPLPSWAVSRLNATLVHVNSSPVQPAPGLPARSAGISRRRQFLGAAVAVVGLTAVAAGLAGHRDEVLLSTPVLLALSVVVAVAIIGGIRPALPSAVAGFLLLNFVFTQPYGTFDVHRFDQALALAVYLATAVAVSVVVGFAARRHDDAVRAGAEAAELSALAGSGVGSRQSLSEVLSRVRTVFGVEYAAVVEPDKLASRVVAASGEPDGDGVEVRVEVSDARALLVRGRPLSADDRRVLSAFARAAVASLERQELAEQAAEAARLATIDQLRTTLIAGVGHDLRTPLAGIKAAVTSLRAEDVNWNVTERAELLAAIESSADRLDALVANLLASSRLDVGALSVELASVGVEEIIGRGLGGVGQLQRVVVDVPDGLPLVLADTGLAERVVANLVDNALRHSGRGMNVLVTAGARSGDVVISVVDTGPGVPAGQRDALFAPYQRLGDRSTGGLGLGLAVARGFTEAMGGRLVPAETPGGGLTMNIHLRPASS